MSVTARTQLKRAQRKCVCVCLCVCLNDGEVSVDPPASSPGVLVPLPDASQCFHGVLEMEGGSLICHTHSDTEGGREKLPPLSTNSQVVLLSCFPTFYG